MTKSSTGAAFGTISACELHRTALYATTVAEIWWHAECNTFCRLPSIDWPTRSAGYERTCLRSRRARLYRAIPLYGCDRHGACWRFAASGRRGMCERSTGSKYASFSRVVAIGSNLTFRCVLLHQRHIDIDKAPPVPRPYRVLTIAQHVGIPKIGIDMVGGDSPGCVGDD